MPCSQTRQYRGQRYSPCHRSRNDPQCSYRHRRCCLRTQSPYLLCRLNRLLGLTLEGVKREPMLHKRVLERDLLARLEVVVRRPCHSLRSIRRLIAVGVGSHAGDIDVNRDDLGGIHHGHAAVLVIHRGLLARIERVRNELNHILVKLGDAHALALHLGIGPRSRDLARVTGGRIQRAFANRTRKVDILRGGNGLVARLRTVSVLRLQPFQRRGHRCDGFVYRVLRVGRGFGSHAQTT